MSPALYPLSPIPYRIALSPPLHKSRGWYGGAWWYVVVRGGSRLPKLHSCHFRPYPPSLPYPPPTTRHNAPQSRPIVFYRPPPTRRPFSAGPPSHPSPPTMQSPCQSHPYHNSLLYLNKYEIINHQSSIINHITGVT